MYHIEEERGTTLPSHTLEQQGGGAKEPFAACGVAFGETLESSPEGQNQNEQKKTSTVIIVQEVRKKRNTAEVSRKKQILLQMYVYVCTSKVCAFILL